MPAANRGGKDQTETVALVRFSLGSSLNGPLRALISHANELLALESAIGPQLEPSLRAHCRVAGFHAGKLTLSADSPIWATKLRFQLPVLMTALRQLAPATELHRIEVKVSPFQPAEESPQQRIALSPASAAHLRDVAQTVSDSKLQKTLLRLASHSTNL